MILVWHDRRIGSCRQLFQYFARRYTTQSPMSDIQVEPDTIEQISLLQSFKCKRQGFDVIQYIKRTGLQLESQAKARVSECGLVHDTRQLITKPVDRYLFR